MIRMSVSQFDDLRKRAESLRKPINPKPRKALSALANAHLRLKEADVTKACVGLMRANHWQTIRLQSGVMRGISGGHPVRLNPNGTPDWLFLRNAASAQWAGHAVVWFCEFKAQGCKPSRVQLDFMADLRNRGMVAEWFDSFEKFSAFVRLTFGVK
jgi:hypothetical protein